MKAYFLIQCYCAAAVCLCSVAVSGDSRFSDESAIRELDAIWSQALKNGNLDLAMSNYADDAIFLGPDAPLIEGKTKIRERFAARMATPGYSASFHPTRIVVSRCGNMAYEIGTFRVTIDDSTGKPKMRFGKHLVTWEKRDGRWTVVAESINYDQASE